MRKYVILLLSILIVGGCSKTPLTLEEKFTKNDYINYDGNYSKQINDVDYYLFDLTSPIKSFVAEENGINMNYFFQNNWSWVNECSYDHETNKVKEGSECTFTDVELLKTLKLTFDNELNKMKIDVKDLIEEVKTSNPIVEEE